MLKSGTTSFLEAGTIRFIDPVVEGLTEIGIRARVGPWAWDLVPHYEALRMTTDQAIARLADAMDRFGSVADGRVQAWPIVIGHTCCSDELWQAAKALSVEHDTGFSFHMSPAAMDPGVVPRRRTASGRWSHLEDIGVLGDNAIATHVVHVDDEEIEMLARTGTSVSHCPTTALKVSYGVTQIGKMPEMVAAGVNVAIGTDGNNASNYHDLMRATYLVAGLFKDARRDANDVPGRGRLRDGDPCRSARAAAPQDEIGSLEVGKKADLVLHDTHRPEWRPLHNVANQLVWSADGRGVHSVYVDGRLVVDDYRCTTIDEDDLLRRAQAAGEGDPSPAPACPTAPSGRLSRMIGHHIQPVSMTLRRQTDAAQLEETTPWQSSPSRAGPTSRSRSATSTARSSSTRRSRPWRWSARTRT